MSWLNTTRVPVCNRAIKLFYLVSLLASLPAAQAAWEIDFSRRRAPASVEAPTPPPQPLSSELPRAELAPELPPAKLEPELPPPVEQEMAVLNTDKGFAPQTLRVRQGGRYLIHVVNINSKEKNVSFILDGFSENHATYFGELKSFVITPQKEGVFNFYCPETSIKGKLVVVPSGGRAAMSAPLRVPAEAENKKNLAQDQEPVIPVKWIEPEVKSENLELREGKP